MTLKHARWCLLKRPGNLTTKQAGRLRGLLRLNLRTARAYLLKEDFNHFWTYISPTWAGNTKVKLRAPRPCSSHQVQRPTS